MKKILKNFSKIQKGFSLAEVVVYVGIVSMVTVSMLGIIWQLVQMRTYSNSKAIVSTEARNVIQELIGQVRECDSFEVEDSTTLNVTKGADVYTYYLDSSTIFLDNGSDTVNLTTNQVSVESLSFTDWTSINSDNLLHVEFSLLRGEVNEDFQTSIHKR